MQLWKEIPMLAEYELHELTQARRLLEQPSLATRLVGMLGAPLEQGLKRLPDAWQESLATATSRALFAALRTAVSTMVSQNGLLSNRWLHTGMAAASGAAGGAFGFSALLLELPISTGIMLRAIACIAREQGEDLSDIEAQLSCLQVFAMCAPQGGSAAETGYFGVRTALARATTDASRFIVERGLTLEGAPSIIRFIGAISGRFAVPVSEKAAAQAIPVLGAAGGAVINTLFINHFQNISQAHFTVRRLERLHGPEAVRAAYSSLR
jgi:hypothetical protein